MQMSSFLLGGKNFFNSLPRTIWNNRMNLHQDDWKEKDEFIIFFKIILDKITTKAMN